MEGWLSFLPLCPQQAGSSACLSPAPSEPTVSARARPNPHGRILGFSRHARAQYGSARGGHWLRQEPCVGAADTTQRAGDLRPTGEPQPRGVRRGGDGSEPWWVLYSLVLVAQQFLVTAWAPMRHLVPALSPFLPCLPFSLLPPTLGMPPPAPTARIYCFPSGSFCFSSPGN